MKNNNEIYYREWIKYSLDEKIQYYQQIEHFLEQTLKSVRNRLGELYEDEGQRFRTAPRRRRANNKK